ncbi:MAG: hypothetical protein V4590_14435 [Bacteroidota bacterium]
MTPLFKKLNYKNTEIGVFNAPDSFASELLPMTGEATIITNLSKVKTGSFLMAFAITQKELDYWSNALVGKLAEDGVLWFCFPKGTSKKYKCEFNRDTGWHELARLGFEGVRSVAIDADWTGLRFRKPAHIKTMTRGFAISAEGKAKTKKK